MQDTNLINFLTEKRNISTKIKNKAAEYADNWIEANKNCYEDDPNKIKTNRGQQIYSKIAEQYVYYLLDNLNIPVSEPNFKIMTKEEKIADNHGPDLMAGNFRIHVKSCANFSVPESYSFNYRDKLLSESSEYDVLFAVAFNYDLSRINLSLALPVQDLTFAPAYFDGAKGKIKCVYARDYPTKIDLGMMARLMGR